jgi:hypothetical protein
MSIVTERAPKPSPAGNDDPPPDPPDEERDGRVDLAALLGAVLTVVLTIFNSLSSWTYVTTIVGALLLCLLVAFFWRHPVTARGKPESIFVALALAALIGTAGAITAAWPMQNHYFADAQDCRAIGVAQAASTVRDLSATDLTIGYIGGTSDQLKSLVENQWGSSWAVNDGTALGDAFHRTYVDASGVCLARHTFDKLWLIAVPLFGLAFAGWLVRFLPAARGRRKEASAAKDLTFPDDPEPRS